MGKLFGKPSAPPAPDLAAAATAQGAANKDTALAQFQLNNANQVTPWGTKTLTPPGPGQPDTAYTVTTTLSPAEQQQLQQSQQLASGLLGTGQNLLGSVGNTLGKPIQTGTLPPMAYQVDTGGSKNLDYSQLPGAQYQVQDPTDIRNQVENAAWGKYISRAAPLMQAQQTNLNTRLANMGGVTTSPGAMMQQMALGRSQGDQVNQAIEDMILQGGNAAQQQQGMELNSANLWNQQRAQDAGLLSGQVAQNNLTNQQNIQNAFANANLANASRSQGLNEQAQLQQIPLNQLMAMLSGTQVNSPQFQPVTPTNIQPAPIFQGAVAQNQANQQSYQNQLGTFNNLLGGAAQLGSAALISDRRLKSKIVRVGATPGGLPVYEYDIFGRRERGVMAQDLLILRPAAVLTHPSGYLMVDYAQVS
jgi:hypothetical protein